MTAITAELVLKIRAEYAAGDTIAAIHAKHGTSRTAISRIVRDIARTQIKRQNTCARCGEPASTKRKYCTNECFHAAQKQQTNDTIAEFEWIVGTDSTENIANRLNFKSIKQMREWLRAKGREDLAEMAVELASVERQGRWAA